MARKFKRLSDWQYMERLVIEPETGKTFTLTQPKSLLEEDFYHIKRTVACENVSVDEIPEDYFHVYEIAYMLPGCQLCLAYVSEDEAAELISSNLPAFLHGNALEKIIEYFRK